MLRFPYPYRDYFFFDWVILFSEFVLIFRIGLIVFCKYSSIFRVLMSSIDELNKYQVSSITSSIKDTDWKSKCLFTEIKCCSVGSFWYYPSIKSFPLPDESSDWVESVNLDFKWISLAFCIWYSIHFLK